MPSAKIDKDTAAISRRYSRTLKGASTRQPPASTTGCSISNCVLTTRWLRTGRSRVHRISALEQVVEAGRITSSQLLDHPLIERHSLFVGVHHQSGVKLGRCPDHEPAAVAPIGERRRGVEAALDELGHFFGDHLLDAFDRLMCRECA